MNSEPGADGSGLLDSPEVHVILDNVNPQVEEGSPAVHCFPPYQDGVLKLREKRFDEAVSD